jgi:hypothetical protein
MRVAPAALLAGRQGPGEVPGGHDGVGGEGPWLKALARRHDPGQGLLYQILHDVPVPDPGADDPSKQRCELDDIVSLAGLPALWGLRHAQFRNESVPMRTLITLRRTPRAGSLGNREAAPGDLLKPIPTVTPPQTSRVGRQGCIGR